MNYLNWSYVHLFWRNLRFHCGNINSLTVMWFSRHVSRNYMISKVIWTEIEKKYIYRKKIYKYIKLPSIFIKRQMSWKATLSRKTTTKSLPKGMTAVVKNKKNYMNMAISFVNVSNFSFFCRLSYHFVLPNRRYISNLARKTIYFALYSGTSKTSF